MQQQLGDYGTDERGSPFSDAAAGHGHSDAGRVRHGDVGGLTRPLAKGGKGAQLMPPRRRGLLAALCEAWDSAVDGDGDMAADGDVAARLPLDTICRVRLRPPSVVATAATHALSESLQERLEGAVAAGLSEGAAKLGESQLVEVRRVTAALNGSRDSSWSRCAARCDGSRER